MTQESKSEPSRRTFLQGVVGLGVAGHLPAARASDIPFRPNILYIHSHDSGRYLSPNGAPAPTPHLEKLAAEGVVFRRAFAAAPTCSPSRSALLTGQCPHRNGMLGLAHLGWKLYDYDRVIIHTLRSAGYKSVLAGLQHIAPKPEMIGYDVLLPHKTQHAKDVAPAAVEFLRNKPAEPFFLDVGFFETHRPYEPDALDPPAHTCAPAGIPDTPATRADMAAFYGSAREMDAGVGRVLEALEAAGLAENTLVISTTDHGIAFPGMKCNLTDAGCGVSLIMRGPRDFHPESVCDAMVSHLDVFPTLCDYLSIPAPAWLEGKSLLPVLRGERPALHDELFAEVTFHAAYEPKRAVRTERWKFIRRYDHRKTAVLTNCDDSPSKQVWLDYGWRTAPTKHEEELFDLIFDPMEHNNLATNPAHKGVLQDMRARLQAWMERTDDPLLHGPVVLPHGYRTFDVNGVYLHPQLEGEPG